VGHSVDEAAWWFITMERSCQAQLLAEAAGTAVLIDDEGARYTRDRTASHMAGWFSFKPLWDEIVRSDPDLYDGFPIGGPGQGDGCLTLSNDPAV